MIVATTCSLTLADEAAVVLPQKDSWRVYPDHNGLPDSWERHFRNEVLTARIIETRQSVSVSDTLAMTEWTRM